jgi:hypothetical protein
MLFILSFAGSAFATGLGSGTPTTAGGGKIKGGSTVALAAASATPLVKFSTNVYGQVNFSFDSTALTSQGYVICTRHTSGSKNFATASNRTNIYWKQATPVTTTVTTAAAMALDIATQDQTSFAFDGTGWTSY